MSGNQVDELICNYIKYEPAKCFYLVAGLKRDEIKVFGFASKPQQ